MKLDLEFCSPAHVATQASVSEIGDAVKARETLSERMAEVLDYVYSERLLKLVRTDAPSQQLAELADHLQDVAHPMRQAKLDGMRRHYFQRWSMMRELLERRIESLRGEVPQQVLQREHVLPILRYVASANEPVEQQDIQRERKLGKANLSRILSLMEHHELVAKQPHGNVNLIALGARGRELLAAESGPERQQAPIGDQPDTPRGNSFMVWDGPVESSELI